ncbi:MAG: hypothetical protein IKQ05_03895 [Prevotella sp.]|jgi:hypothetical protein|nr:hypothetical protein [Prevotella sp.]
MRKSLFLAFVLSVLCLSAQAKKYPFDMDHGYQVEQIRVAQGESRFIKVWGISSGVDKAIIRAQQDAVAACIFEGIPACQVAGAVPPLCAEGRKAYEAHKAYFDEFFIRGEFLNYAKNTNTRYPTGENNVSTPEGRKVAIYVQLDVQQLRKKLEADGIIKSFENVFDK